MEIDDRRDAKGSTLDIHHLTPSAGVHHLLNDLCARIQATLSARLSGLYLFGSLVTGDFDLHSSDLDLLAVTSTELDADMFARLFAMHVGFTRAYPEWDDRVEVVYMSARALATFRTQRSDIAVISPGEPFHSKDAGDDWLVNWYVVRERGIALYGPPPTALIGPITFAEYVAGVRDYALDWRERIEQMHSRRAQAYAILTMCRAYYTLREGVFASKLQAALWAERLWPEWSSLIMQALRWRSEQRDAPVDHVAALAQTRRFVQFAAEQCEAATLPPQATPAL